MSPEGQGVVVVVVGKRIPLPWYASSFILFCNDLPTLLLHACCLRPIAPPFPPFPPRLPFVTSPPSLSIHTSLAGLSLQGRRRGRKRKETYGRGHRISNRLCLHFQTYRQRERACGESHSTWSRHVNECPLSTTVLLHTYVVVSTMERIAHPWQPPRPSPHPRTGGEKNLGLGRVHPYKHTYRQYITRYVVLDWTYVFVRTADRRRAEWRIGGGRGKG